jgi:hypothetical protein
MRGERVWAILRVAYGLFFLATGLFIVVATTTGMLAAPVQPTASAQALTDALDASGFMDPLLAAAYVAGGGALLFNRSAPLGIVVLAGPVAVILFFHLTLSGQYIWGPLVAAALAALAWHYRVRLETLWTLGKGN